MFESESDKMATIDSKGENQKNRSGGIVMCAENLSISNSNLFYLLFSVLFIKLLSVHSGKNSMKNAMSMQNKWLMY